MDNRNNPICVLGNNNGSSNDSLVAVRMQNTVK